MELSPSSSAFVGVDMRLACPGCIALCGLDPETLFANTTAVASMQGREPVLSLHVSDAVGNVGIVRSIVKSPDSDSIISAANAAMGSCITNGEGGRCGGGLERVYKKR